METISDTSMAFVGHTTDNDDEEEDYDTQVLAGESQSPANIEDFSQFAVQFIGQMEESSSSTKDKGGGGVGGRKRVKGGKGAAKLRIGSWNIGTLTGKSIELAKILEKRKISIACVQKSRWVGDRARDVDGFKLWFSGGPKGKNGVGILVDRELRVLVVGVKKVSDRLMTIKIVVGGHTLNVVSAYAPQAGQDEEIKRRFWEDLDEVVWGFPHSEKLFLGGDFNGHIGSSARGYGDVHGGFGFGDRNERGTALLDFARAFNLVIANSSF
ncbi:uncharacterized protein LOC132639642 [Lycium barbarum]|uniref:uncharacterized protein LOC132639642 n=1 Tax=Lycium barbarum TaxID=112863 RepID=UPI00293F2758|nr:uncharacterized protein LOC132639642 [Lycium barbarum]